MFTVKKKQKKTCKNARIVGFVVLSDANTFSE